MAGNRNKTKTILNMSKGWSDHDSGQRKRAPVNFDPDNLFFTSDTHFGHVGVITYGRRPFGSVQEMDAALISAWNETVPSNADVFHLGDVSFMGTTRTMDVLSRLNGRIHLIEGNHDRGASNVVRARYSSIAQYRELKIEGHKQDGELKTAGNKIILCHFPFESWDSMHYGSWHLHGHCHGSLPGFGRRLDVGMDALRFWHPISYRAIAARMAKLDPSSRDSHQPRV